MTRRRIAVQENRPSFDALRDAAAVLYTPADLRLMERAYATAARAHEGQRRRSGAPYITHPLIVAGIVVDSDASAEAVCAALLHDVVDDTPYILSRLRREFGTRIAALVEGLHQRDALRESNSDPEVALLTLADRLHNLRTLAFLNRAKQRRVARETLDVYVPLADRMGLPGIRRELADLAGSTLGWSELRRRADSSGKRLLAAGAMLLPGDVRFRWFDEWVGELGVLPTGWARARFAAQTLRAIPSLAVTLRRPRRRALVDRGGTEASRGSSSVLLSLFSARAEMPAWLVVAIPLTCMAVVTAVIFAPTGTAARRLSRLISAWRGF